MKRIGIVVQRYGEEVNGGAELHARLWAERLAVDHDVDVLTSRALSYRTWDPHYEAGDSELRGVRIRRFDHPARTKTPDRHMPLGPKLRWKLTRRGWVSPRPSVLPPNGDPRRDGELFLCAQGPAVESLIAYLRERQQEYDAIFCFTALYYPAAMGVLAAPSRALLVPTLHDEKAMYLPLFHRVFRAPRLILYNTVAERELAHRLYGDDLAASRICGVGIDVPSAQRRAELRERWPQTAARYDIDHDFVLYLGRIEPSKGCDELLDHFLAWRQRRGTGDRPCNLVLAGQAFMPLRDEPSIRYTGFVSDDERDQLLAHARALVVPSRYESLSLVALEAMAHGCPLIVTSGSEVLVRHVADSGAGLTYGNEDAFARALDATLADSNQQLDRQAAAARYVTERYAWPRIMSVIHEAVDTVSRSSSRESTMT